MEKLQPNPYMYAELGHTRTWGFYSSKELALKVLHENISDLWETIYNYAILEEYCEGIGNCNIEQRQFFKYDKSKNGYFEIEEPDFTKHLCNFAFG